MTPMERAARTLWEVLGRPSKSESIAPGDTAAERDWERFLPHARAVLQAIREPTDDMTQAGAAIVRNVHVEESDAAFASDAANTWRFMVDAALVH